MKYTPMIEQYLKIKKDYQDAFVFYRLGDFYEMFFEDATKASKILEITFKLHFKFWNSFSSFISNLH